MAQRAPSCAGCCSTLYILVTINRGNVEGNISSYKNQQRVGKRSLVDLHGHGKFDTSDNSGLTPTAPKRKLLWLEGGVASSQ